MEKFETFEEALRTTNGQRVFARLEFLLPGSFVDV